VTEGCSESLARPPTPRRTAADPAGAGAGVEPDAWERAYLRFETPAQEQRKFRRRFAWLGASSWPRDARVVELFCGRGGGLLALERLGFTQLEGVDRSAALIARYPGRARCHVADCRALPLESGSRDVVVVQGGLHHLARLPEDLEATLAEVHRVLRSGGLLAVVEPWRTPFLDLVHAACRIGWLTRRVPKLDAFATMAIHERDTYERWLAEPALVRTALEGRFETVKRRIAWGKLYYVGRRPD
jgi:SAM-dependent methyltransferase